jgi:hypothetical protein
MRNTADRFRAELVEQFGDERGRQIEYAEAFEISEYGGDLTTELASDFVSP